MTEKTDHDLLIELRTDVKNLLKRLEGNVPEQCINHAARIHTLEDKAEAFERLHQAEIQRIWNHFWWGAGLIITGVVGAVLANIVKQ